MENLPILQNRILETVFYNRTLSQEQLEEILACEKTSLTKDLHSIIDFCSSNYSDTTDNISNNLLYYALFLLKQNESENQLNLILDILKWPDEKIYYWFSDLFTEYYWCLVYHFWQNETETLVAFLKNENFETFCKEQVALALCQIYLKKPENQNTISNYWTELLELYNNIPENSENIDYTYLAFFVNYIYQPSPYQKQLINSLYDKEYIDLGVNGYSDELFEIEEEERKCVTVFDLNDDFIKYENRDKSNVFDLFDELIKYENKDNSNFGSKMLENNELLNQAKTPYVAEKKINRNDPCTCGSGKKYKKCCLK